MRNKINLSNDLIVLNYEIGEYLTLYKVSAEQELEDNPIYGAEIKYDGAEKIVLGKKEKILLKILENQILLDSKTIKDIKEIIDNPKEYFKKGHLLEVSLNSDLTIHKLNRLRFLARELEIQAIDYFVEDYKVNRKDLLEAFNVLSDVIYIIILKYDNGDYR